MGARPNQDGRSWRPRRHLRPSWARLGSSWVPSSLIFSARHDPNGRRWRFRRHHRPSWACLANNKSIQLVYGKVYLSTALLWWHRHWKYRNADDAFQNLSESLLGISRNFASPPVIKNCTKCQRYLFEAKRLSRPVDRASMLSTSCHGLARLLQPVGRASMLRTNCYDK